MTSAGGSTSVMVHRASLRTALVRSALVGAQGFCELATKTRLVTGVDASPDEVKLHVHRVLCRVTAAITPWNFPMSMITRKVSPALAVGCPVHALSSHASVVCN